MRRTRALRRVTGKVPPMLALALVACWFESPSYEGTRYRCSAPALECPDGFDCVVGWCSATAGARCVTGVRAGGAQTCTWTSAGTASCWGENAYGNVGGTPGEAQRTPVVIASVADVVDGAVGRNHTCLVQGGGALFCWGLDNFGQVGNGPDASGTSVRSPAMVLADAIRVATGEFHTCAIRAGGAVSCWGRNASGQLGTGDTIDSDVPVLVSSVTATAIGAGDEHTCALATDGTVRCWGANDTGQLGDGTTARRSAPVRAGALVATAIAVGRTHTCALAGTSVSCFGANVYGQLGTSGDFSTTPREVQGIAATQIFAADLATCARSTTDTVVCWGDAPLGAGPSGDRVELLAKDVSTVVGGGAHACAIVAGSLYCWGANDDGQLGSIDVSIEGGAVQPAVGCE